MIKQVLNTTKYIKNISQLTINCKYYNCNYKYNYIKFKKKININQFNNLNVSVCEKCGIHLYEIQKNN